MTIPPVTPDSNSDRFGEDRLPPLAIAHRSSPIADRLFGDGADRRDPDEVNCAFWRTEVEVGLRFYHRLAHTDPIQAMRLFDQSEAQIDPLDRRSPSGQPKMPF